MSRPRLTRPLPIAGVACALALAHPAALRAAPGLSPEAEIPGPILWMDVDLPPAPEALALARKAHETLDARARRAAVDLGWQTFSNAFSTTAMGASTVALLRDGPVAETLDGVMGDVGLILSMAQVHRDLQRGTLPPGSGLALLRDTLLWAAGRYGWPALSTSASLLGIGATLLDKVGQASIAARIWPARVAFEVYFGTGMLGKGDGELFGKDLWKLFWKAKVTSVEQAEALLRRRFAAFWALGPEAIERYTVPERVKHEVGWLGRLLYLGVGGKPVLTSLTRKDERAIEDDYLARVYAPHLRTYFETVLPGLVTRQARAAAARRLEAIRQRLNARCRVTVLLTGVPPDLAEATLHLGPLRWAITSASKQRVTLTRYAYARLPTAERTALVLTWREAGGQARRASAPMPSPLASLPKSTCPDARVRFDLGATPQAPSPDAPSVDVDTDDPLGRLRAAARALGLPWVTPSPTGAGQARVERMVRGGSPFGPARLTITLDGARATYALVARDRSRSMGLGVQRYPDETALEEAWQEEHHLDRSNLLEERETRLAGRACLDIVAIDILEDGDDPLMGLTHVIESRDGLFLLEAHLQRSVRGSALRGALPEDADLETVDRQVRAAALARSPRAPVAELRALLGS